MWFKFDIQSTTYSLIIRWSVVLALGVLLISMASGQLGVSNYLSLLKNREWLQQNNMQLQIANQMLQKQYDDLTHSKIAQELFVREDLGMIKPGETVVHIIPAEEKENPLETPPVVNQTHEKIVVSKSH